MALKIERALTPLPCNRDFSILYEVDQTNYMDISNPPRITPTTLRISDVDKLDLLKTYDFQSYKAWNEFQQFFVNKIISKKKSQNFHIFTNWQWQKIIEKFPNLSIIFI